MVVTCLLYVQGGLIAVLAAAQIQDQLDGIILSAASLELSTTVAGPLEVSINL